MLPKRPFLFFWKIIKIYKIGLESFTLLRIAGRQTTLLSDKKGPWKLERFILIEKKFSFMKQDMLIDNINLLLS